MLQKRFKYLILSLVITCAMNPVQAQDSSAVEKSGQVIDKPADIEKKIEKPAEPLIKEDKSKLSDDPAAEKEVKIEPKKIEKDPVNPEKIEKQVKAKDKKEKKEEPKKERDAKEQKIAEESVDKTGIAGLLPYNDENYKYFRIPELQMKDDKREQDSKLVTVSDESQEKKTGKDEKGLFGMSKSASDIFAKFSLLFLVIIVFLMYKSRSRKSVKKTSRYTK